MQAKITKRKIDALKPGTILADDEIKGFVARCLDSGAVTYGYRYRDKVTGKQRWIGLGLHGSITADEARVQAKKRAGEVADSRDPVAERETTRTAAAKAKVAETNTVDAILDAFVARHVKNLRSGDQVERAFDVYVRPLIGSKSIYELTRRNIVEMLDAIEDGQIFHPETGDKLDGGPVMADKVLAHVRKAFNWQAARDDLFSSPIIRGMARTKPRERARERVLADDEIRSLWAALDSPEAGHESFRRMVRVLLLTAQRRNEVAGMHADELDGDGWTIAAERYKTNKPQFVPLTAEALRWIGEPDGFAFSTGHRGDKAYSGFSKSKASLNGVIAKQRKAEGLKPMPNFTLHDLRRTARTLMSRAKVPGEISERVLGHEIGGVEGVYDRHAYAEEKREALERLAALLERIINPPAVNVVQLDRVTA